MIGVLRTSWPLLLGVLLLMVGNGMQSTLLGIRGNLEGMATWQMSVVMSAYFAGFLIGSRMAPGMIQRVGHVRVFAALGSMISAVLIVYAAMPDWIVWTLLRLIIGFCFCGVYITAESWLNAASSNDNRGQALSAYMIVQMVGIVSAQYLMTVADPAGYALFVLPSVLVSVAFTPILLSAQPAPVFGDIKRMSMRELYAISPLGCIGIALVGGVFSTLFGMTAVWGAESGLSVSAISGFVAATYLGGLVLQFPVGWLSDRMDRRILILGLSVLGAVTVGLVILTDPPLWGLLLAGGIIGGVANPAYSLLLAYTNDYLQPQDMAAASAGLLFLNGLGSMLGPLAVGWLMSVVGVDGYWIYMGLMLVAMAGYTMWRMTRRPAAAADQTGSFAVISPVASPLAVEAALGEASDDDPLPPSDHVDDKDLQPAPSSGTITKTEDEMSDLPDQILDFWLNQLSPADWYNSSPALDQTIRDRFLPAWEQAETLVPGWMDDPRNALAALILTDQFPRNMFRDDPRSFATDDLARALARQAIEAGHDMATDVPARQFFYMPFMHSESLADQTHAKALFAARMPGDNQQHAEWHRQVIARFGRFPWRNPVLGRDTTPDERSFLDAGGYGAMVQGKLSLAGDA